MGDKTKIKRIAACIMSTALVFGFAGSIKPPAAPVIAAETENENEYIKVSYNADTNMYEYEFIDAYIYDIDADPRFVRITLIPSTGRNTAPAATIITSAKAIRRKTRRSRGWS